MKNSILSRSFIALIFGAVVPLASAVPVQVMTRGALGANDFKDWVTVGANNTNVSNPFTTLSNGGLSMNISQAGSGLFVRRDQSNGWSGNFAPGDAVLWTGGANGPITVAFAAPIFGVGFQIQSAFQGAFTATLEAFTSSNVSLGVFSVLGNSTTTADNSAVFLGILDNTAEISRIVFDTPLHHNFAINLMSLRTSPAAVPETGASAVLLCLGLGGALLAQWKLGARKIA